MYFPHILMLLLVYCACGVWRWSADTVCPCSNCTKEPADRTQIHTRVSSPRRTLVAHSFCHMRARCNINLGVVCALRHELWF
ncbi:hypothetical protein B0T17DRAFT_169008 [Bombardia bombarda]|uniref:Secreted protein n=1 Tax=Bombardia bombarda TaxID=252184 RepID=A0AA39X8G9_9PEZI|nr:hypothetical protein B0T17DRAFT_169008 [Bombardia bombarda]